MILSVSHRVKSMSSQKNPIISHSSYLWCKAIVCFCLLSNPFPIASCPRLQTKGSVAPARSDKTELALKPQLVLAPLWLHRATEIKGRVCMTQTLSLVTSESPRSTSQPRWHCMDPKATQVYLHGQVYLTAQHGQQPLSQDVPPRPTSPLSQLWNCCLYKLIENCWERVNHWKLCASSSTSKCVGQSRAMLRTWLFLSECLQD